MISIDVKGLSKNYQIAEKEPGLRGSLKYLFLRTSREVKAVQGINFSINEGEMVGFIGPNGAGKTTTLKMLCGLIHPSSGLISVAGYKPQRRSPKFLRKITLVMGQKQQLIWDLPPIESLLVNAAIYGISESETKRRIKNLGEMLELDDELYRPVRKLSLGQRMKAELLASLLHLPSVLFLDEPTLGLDVNSQIRVRDFLLEYNRKYGATIFLTSHYMADITSLCERVLVLHKGNLFHDGSMASLTEKLTPYRSVKIEFSNLYPLSEFRKYGSIHESNDHYVHLLIPRERVIPNISEILEKYSVTDLEIKDPPIENLISRLFLKDSKK